MGWSDRRVDRNAGRARIREAVRPQRWLSIVSVGLERELVLLVLLWFEVQVLSMQLGGKSGSKSRGPSIPKKKGTMDVSARATIAPSAFLQT